MAAPTQSPTEPVERGAYLASLARCGMCHTPVDESGNPIEGMMLANAFPKHGGAQPDARRGHRTRPVEREIAAFLATVC